MERTANSGRSLKNYLVGFVLAIILTAIPFALVAVGELPIAALFAIIAVSAVAQVLVHLRYFLHLSPRHTPRENIVALVFAAVLVLIMIGGTLWIMFNTGYRHGM